MASKRPPLRNRIELTAYGVFKSLFRVLPLRLAGGLAVPFFGRPALTTTPIARLAEKTGALFLGALFLPVACLRIAPGRYRLVYSEPLDVNAIPPEERGVEQLTALITAFVERQVRAAPQQWRWVHDRWRDGLSKCP